MRATLRGRLSIRRARMLSALLAAAAVVITAGIPTGGAAADPSPSGRGDFVGRIAWTSSTPAPGLELLTGTFGDPSVHPNWTVTIQAPTTSPLDGSTEFAEAGSGAWAQRTESALTSDGFTPRADTLFWPRYVDDPHGFLGVRVRVGQFATQAAASSEAGTLTADGFHPLVEWEGFDPQPAPDAELLHAAIVDPRRFAGRVIAYHGSAVASRQTVAAQAQQLGALAAVNAGFFTINAALTDVGGVPTGLGVYDGRLESLANGDRADLVLNGRGPARIENLRTSARLEVGGSSATILGINRQPGTNEDCGVPGFSPTSEPRQGVLCTGANDLVLFTPEFGAPLPTPSGPATQAILDGHDRVVSVGPAGGSLPAGDSALQAIGADATWLSAHVHPGQAVSLVEQVRDDDGAPLRLGRQTSIVSAAPVLLRNGRTAIDASREGVFDPRDLFNYGFSAERHARTIAGVDRRGRLLLVTADGVPGVSEGLTLSEEAALMRSLGAVDAMNLDGGGSTSFVVGGQTVNHTSDATGPRAIGDSIQIVP